MTGVNLNLTVSGVKDELNLTVDELAERLFISRCAVYSYTQKRNKRKPPLAVQAWLTVVYDSYRYIGQTPAITKTIKSREVIRLQNMMKARKETLDSLLS